MIAKTIRLADDSSNTPLRLALLTSLLMRCMIILPIVGRNGGDSSICSHEINIMHNVSNAFHGDYTYRRYIKEVYSLIRFMISL